MNNYDVIIIGSGLGGLVCGAILSKHGYKVCIYEKNKQMGGCLQTYARDKVIFDSGVHYIGGLAPGQNLYEVFDYLGIMRHLKIRQMDEDGFDRITFGDSNKEFKIAQGYDNFIRQLLVEFPEERTALHNYCSKVREVCAKFPLYNLRVGDGQEKESVMGLNTKEVIASITDNERLRQVLAGNNLLYAGVADKTPFYIHALVLNSYIESAWKCVDGGSQIAKWLGRCIMDNGGVIRRHAEVKRIVDTGGNISHVQLGDGQIARATHFISNLHPAQTMAITESDLIRNAYRARVSSLENGIGPFVLNVVLKPQSFPYLNYNVYHHESSDAWAGIDYTTDDWPQTFAVMAAAGSKEPAFAESLAIMTYMRYGELDKWKNTFNTVSHETDRGPDYEAFKEEKANRLLDRVEKRFPGLRNCIHSYYAATPLSYRDYLGTTDGSMYGVLKDYKDPLRTRISPRTRVPNLYLTGQNLNLHGILGVTMSAVMTCGEFIGLEKLVDAIRNRS
ncbi:NAD(P)/FAD-dependent oxidoreductase [Chitinophaga pendula]|uniref:phytoene desaturase family protein n=1 Tax=Chitinophaga TaxID=79328 RepID=UPI000BB09866|nr:MULTISPECIES: NAD(P)/FAD-dependent oxidoreductase [Chitinophaga]ASZ11473.1 all-trans-retinol 13,14-reductase [Chitinophaga sp. MD30]UCJ05516.1 NAD(P)/FAD-dependent oxidoreductase [Chitinophaga pendula]